MTLGRLRGATFITPDINLSIDAYGNYLNYKGAHIERITADIAHRWGAPAAEGARMATLWPEGGEDSFIRFVESDVPADYHPLTTYGWSAAEIVVKDLNVVAKRLSESPFKVIGPPAVLEVDFTDKIRAMQVVGPGKEVLYLTEITGNVPGFDLPKPVTMVGQIFVAVISGKSLTSQAEDFLQTFAIAVGPAFQAGVSIISNAHGLPDSTKYELGVVPLAGQTLLELDTYPPSTRERPLSTCGLPLGMAMATFDCHPNDFETLTKIALSKNRNIGSEQRNCVVQTPSGILFELISK